MENESSDNKTDFEEHSTSMQDDNTFEVKESLLDKIKNIFRPNDKKALPGNDFVKIKRTNMSLGGFYRIQDIKESITSAFENISRGISNLMKPKEPEITNPLYNAEPPSEPLKNIIILGQTETTRTANKLESTTISVDKEFSKSDSIVESKPSEIEVANISIGKENDSVKEDKDSSER